MLEVAMSDKKIRENKEILSKNVIRLRKSKKIAQERLGLEAGVDRTVISKIERQLSNPSLEILTKISTYLGVEISELFKK